MGADEAVPFSEKATAEKFARENGGAVVAFTEVPSDYVLGATAGAPDAVAAPAEQEQHLHHQSSAPETGHAH